MPANAGRKIGVQELSAELGIPQHFLAKTAQDMVKHAIVSSSKGPTGGFFGHERTANVSISEVLKVTDGSFETCALGIRHCDAQSPCPLRHGFARCRNGMLATFSVGTIGQLADEVGPGSAFLVRPAQ